MVEKLILDGTKGAHIIFIYHTDSSSPFEKDGQGKVNVNQYFLCPSSESICFGGIFLCLIICHWRENVSSALHWHDIERNENREDYHNYYHPHMYEHGTRWHLCISYQSTRQHVGRVGRNDCQAKASAEETINFIANLAAAFVSMAYFCCLLWAKEYRSVRLSQAHFMAFRALIGSILLRVSSLRVHS